MSPAAAKATHNVDYNVIPIKTPDQIAMMREAGKICAQILQDLTPHVKPGVTTQQINDIAYDLIVNKYGADVDREAPTLPNLFAAFDLETPLPRRCVLLLSI